MGVENTPQTRIGGRLFKLYTKYVSEPESTKHVYGYALLVVGYLFDLGTRRELLRVLWAASVVLLPLVVLEARRTDTLSWPVIGGLVLPGVNLVAALGYSYARFTESQPSSGRHGALLFLAVLATGLSLVIAPYIFGPVAVVAGFWIRSKYDRPQGALLVTASGVTVLLGLILHTVYFTFIRPGPVL